MWRPIETPTIRVVSNKKTPRVTNVYLVAFYWLVISTSGYIFVLIYFLDSLRIYDVDPYIVPSDSHFVPQLRNFISLRLSLSLSLREALKA